MKDLKELAKVVEMAQACENMRAQVEAAIQIVARSNSGPDLTINSSMTSELFHAVQSSIIGALEERKAELLQLIHQETAQ